MLRPMFAHFAADKTGKNQPGLTCLKTIEIGKAMPKVVEFPKETR